MWWTNASERPTALRRLLLASIVVQVVAGWRTRGVLSTRDHYASYAGKFCFDNIGSGEDQAGRFMFKVHGKTQGKLYLIVYDDEEKHWERVHEQWVSGNLDCEAMLKDACSECVWPITPEGGLDGEYNGTMSIARATRPRFWYFAFAACGVKFERPVVYDFHALNLGQGMQMEFGFDERNSLGLQFGTAVLFTCTAYLLRHMARKATGAEALRSRPLLRMLLGSAACSGAGSMCLAFHYLIYMGDGNGVVPLEVLGQVFVCCSKALLTLLQLLTAKGWALFYSPEELVRRQVMMCILGGIVGASVLCEIHADYFYDWSTTLYLYESWPGLVILVLNFVLFAEAWRSMRETYRFETSEEVRCFYIMISAASLIYFLTLPFVCVLAVAFPPWERAKWVARMEVTARFFAVVLLSICLRPSRLDAMVNARLEEGLETVGELRDDITDEDSDSPRNGDRTKEVLFSRDEEAMIDLLSPRSRAEAGAGYVRSHSDDYFPEHCSRVSPAE